MEKDYWIMHCLNGLTQQGFQFELKGGTSLSKGFGIIKRFSEDIDIRIDPAEAPFDDNVHRSGGIRLIYESQFDDLSGLKEGILFEVGFDDTTPFNFAQGERN